MDEKVTEKELQYKLADFLKQWFYVQREVWSIGGEKRIDIVLIHKTNLDDKYFPIGCSQLK
jgi:hypothetical protein